MARYLLLTAGMGAGHAQVGAELARRLAARGNDVQVVDILDVLPLRFGPALRGGYAWMIRRAPWLYEGIYRGFFAPAPRAALRSDPLVIAAAARVRKLVERSGADAVVPVFHLCGQITGRLRARGEIEARSIVVVTDFAAHRQWTHPGNDAFVCVHDSVATQVRAATDRPAFAPGPIVGAAFSETLSPDDERARRDAVRRELGVAADARVVLMSAGAWGSGDVIEAVADLASPTHRTVVLCGRSDELRRRVSARDLPGVIALGWRSDVAALMRGADVLVENAAGLTAFEAMAVGLPVVSFRPLAGHGRAGVQAMARAGVVLAADRAAVQESVRELAQPQSAVRRQLVARARAAFAGDAAAVIAGLAGQRPTPS